MEIFQIQMYLGCRMPLYVFFGFFFFGAHIRSLVLEVSKRAFMLSLLLLDFAPCSFACIILTETLIKLTRGFMSQ